jgi:hypothetical protein
MTWIRITGSTDKKHRLCVWYWYLVPEEEMSGAEFKVLQVQMFDERLSA